MASEAVRQSIRGLYDFRCGYCGVTEIEAGGQLEVDHFCPRSQGGPDTLDNLVYACRTCNAFKGAYWPLPGAGTDVMLLHPRRDDLAAHIGWPADGRLVGLTERGSLHIHRLRLNRVQLVELRRERAEAQRLREALEHNTGAEAQLRDYVLHLEQEIQRLLEIIVELTGQ